MWISRASSAVAEATACEGTHLNPEPSPQVLPPIATTTAANRDVPKGWLHMASIGFDGRAHSRVANCEIRLVRVRSVHCIAMTSPGRTRFRPKRVAMTLSTSNRTPPLAPGDAGLQPHRSAGSGNAQPPAKWCLGCRDQHGIPWLFLAPSGALHSEARSPTGPRAPSADRTLPILGAAVIPLSSRVRSITPMTSWAHTFESILRHRPSSFITTLGLGSRHLGGRPQSSPASHSRAPSAASLF